MIRWGMARGGGARRHLGGGEGGERLSRMRYCQTRKREGLSPGGAALEGVPDPEGGLVDTLVELNVE